MRYFATRLKGDGTEELISDYLPLSGVSITRTLSGVNSLTGKLEPEFLDLLGPDGRPVLIPWSSAIYAEDDEGEIVHGALLTSLKSSGPSLDLTAVGFLGYISGMPWVDKPLKYYAADPAAIMRTIWSTVQSHPGGNLGLTLSAIRTTATVGSRVLTPSETPKPTKDVKTSSTSTATVVTTTEKTTALYKDRNVVTTTVTRQTTDKKTKKVTTTRTVSTKTTYATKRVVTKVDTYTGSKLTASKTTTSSLAATAKVTLLTETVTSDEPYVITQYDTADLGQTFAELANAGSLDYREVHAWDGDRIAHRLDLGFPRLGTRRNDLLFDTRVNVTTIPEVTLDASDYASSVLILAAGEGDKMVRAVAETKTPSRLRRVVAIERKGIGRQATADKAAADALKLRQSAFPVDIQTLTVRDSDLAPMGAWEVGDEVRLVGPVGWAGDVDMYVRIMEEDFDPEESVRTLTVTPADRT